MDLSFSSEQSTLRDLARQIFDGMVTTDRLKEIEAGPDRFDRALWAECARAGLLGVGIPEEHGGVGGGLLETCVVLEETGRAVAPAPLLHVIASGALPIARYGSEEQQRTWLPPIARGEAIVTAALSGDVAMRGGALNGSAPFVPVAHLASAIVVVAGDSLFVVSPERVTMERQVATNGEPQALLTFDGTPAVRLGGPGAAAWLRDVATVAACAVAVGVCDRALRMTAAYVTEREQFGRPLGSFQAVQQRAADCYIDVEAMRWTMWQAAWRLSEGLDAAEAIAVAKFWTAEAGQRIVSAAQHLHGGIGVDLEYPLHRYTTWAKQMELTFGSAHPQLERLGDLMAAEVR